MILLSPVQENHSLHNFLKGTTEVSEMDTEKNTIMHADEKKKAHLH